MDVANISTANFLPARRDIRDWPIWNGGGSRCSIRDPMPGKLARTERLFPMKIQNSPGFPPGSNTSICSRQTQRDAAPDFHRAHFQANAKTVMAADDLPETLLEYLGLTNFTTGGSRAPLKLASACFLFFLFRRVGLWVIA